MRKVSLLYSYFSFKPTCFGQSNNTTKDFELVKELNYEFHTYDLQIITICWRHVIVWEYPVILKTEIIEFLQQIRDMNLFISATYKGLKEFTKKLPDTYFWKKEEVQRASASCCFDMLNCHEILEGYASSGMPHYSTQVLFLVAAPNYLYNTHYEH